MSNKCNLYAIKMLDNDLWVSRKDEVTKLTGQDTALTSNIYCAKFFEKLDDADWYCIDNKIENFTIRSFEPLSLVRGIQDSMVELQEKIKVNIARYIQDLDVLGE